jgi:hypothetical protein
MASKRRAYYKDYYAARRAYFLRKAKEWYEANKERKARYQRVHKDEVNARQRKYYKRDRR